jgi:hypothetical protein
MLLWDTVDWLGWLWIIRCSTGREFLLDFTLERSKKLSVISALQPEQPNGYFPQP